MLEYLAVAVVLIQACAALDDLVSGLTALLSACRALVLALLPRSR